MNQTNNTQQRGNEPSNGQPYVPPQAPAPQSNKSERFFQWIRESHVERSNNRVVAGVCAGVAQTLGWNVTLVRVLMVVLAFCGGFGVVFYGLAWMLLPDAMDHLILLQEVIQGHWDWAFIGVILCFLIALFNVLPFHWFGWWGGWQVHLNILPLLLACLAMYLLIDNGRRRFMDRVYDTNPYGPQGPSNSGYGPQGPQGPRGPQGPQGPQYGPQGQQFRQQTFQGPQGPQFSPQNPAQGQRYGAAGPQNQQVPTRGPQGGARPANAPGFVQQPARNPGNDTHNKQYGPYGSPTGESYGVSGQVNRSELASESSFLEKAQNSEPFLGDGENGQQVGNNPGSSGNRGTFSGAGPAGSPNFSRNLGMAYAASPSQGPNPSPGTSGPHPAGNSQAGAIPVVQPSPQQPKVKYARRKPAGPVIVLITLALIFLAVASVVSLTPQQAWFDNLVQAWVVLAGAVCAGVGLLVIILGCIGRRSGGLQPIAWIAMVMAVVMCCVGGVLVFANGWKLANVSGYSSVRVSHENVIEPTRGNIATLKKGIMVDGGSYDHDVLNIDLTGYAKNHGKTEVKLMDGSTRETKCPVLDLPMTVTDARVIVTIPDGCSWNFGTVDDGINVMDSVGGKNSIYVNVDSRENGTSTGNRGFGAIFGPNEFSITGGNITNFGGIASSEKGDYTSSCTGVDTDADGNVTIKDGATKKVKELAKEGYYWPCATWGDKSPKKVELNIDPQVIVNGSVEVQYASDSHLNTRDWNKLDIAREGR